MEDRLLPPNVQRTFNVDPIARSWNSKARSMASPHVVVDLGLVQLNRNPSDLTSRAGTHQACT